MGKGKRNVEAQIRGLDVDKFWSRVNKTSNCWLWTGARQSKKGVPVYGNVAINKQWLGAHRISWMLAFGAIPEGAWVLHKCDNPVCVNPKHLFLGTVIDNNRDMWAKRRGISNLPEHGNAKVSIEDVKKIRRLYAGGMIQAEIAKKFGTCQANISRIVLKKSWPNV